MTGVFCNSAIKAAENDHDLAVQSLVQTRKELQEQVVQLFSAIDKRGRGQLTISEFERHFADDAVKARDLDYIDFIAAMSRNVPTEWKLVEICMNDLVIRCSLKCKR